MTITGMRMNSSKPTFPAAAPLPELRCSEIAQTPRGALVLRDFNQLRAVHVLRVYGRERLFDDGFDTGEGLDDADAGGIVGHNVWGEDQGEGGE